MDNHKYNDDCIYQLQSVLNFVIVKAHFYAYGVIGEADPLFQVFTGQPDPIISSQKVIEFLQNLSTDVDEIVVHINSRGGSVYEGFAIHDLLFTSGKKITTIAEGLVASIATVVYLAGSQREITPNAQLMIHNPWIDPTMIAGLTADEIQKMADDMKQEENRIVDFYVQKTGADRALIADMMRAETFIGADKALEMKFSTEIIKTIKAFAYLPNNLKNKDNQMSNEVKSLGEKLGKKLDQVIAFIKGEVTEIKDDTTEAAATEVKAEAMTTDDGKTINVDGGLVVGATVTDEAGNPVPDQTFVINGVTIETDSDSKISSVTDPMSAEAAANQLRIDEAVANATKEANDKITELEAKLTASQAQHQELQNQYSGLEEKVNLIAKSVKSTFNPDPQKTEFNSAHHKKANAPSVEELKSRRENYKQKKS